MIDVSGTIRAYAGSGQPFGELGDGGPAVSASLSAPSALTLDSAGRLLIVDTGHGRVRRVEENGDISTVSARFVIVGKNSELRHCMIVS